MDGVAASPASRLVRGRGARSVEHVGAVAARHVGQLHAVHAAAVLVVERQHLGQLGGPPLGVEHRDVRAGEHEVLDRLAVDGLPVAELVILDEAEQLAEDQRLGGVAAAAPGCRSAHRAGVPTGSSRCAGSRPGRSARRARARGRSRGGRGRGRTSGRPGAAITASTERVGERDLLGARDGGAVRRAARSRARRASPGRGRSRGRRGRAATMTRVSLPVPAPSSRTLSAAGRRASSCTASAGYVGRPRS